MKYLIFSFSMLLILFSTTDILPDIYGEETTIAIHTNPDISDGGDFSEIDGPGVMLGVIIEGELQDNGHIFITTTGVFSNSKVVIPFEDSHKVSPGSPKHLFLLDLPFKYDEMYTTTISNGDFSKTIKWTPLSSSGKSSEPFEIPNVEISSSLSSPPGSYELENYADEVMNFIVYLEKDNSLNSAIMTFKGKYSQLPAGDDSYDTIPSYSDPLRYNIPVRIDHNYDDEKFNVGVTSNGDFDFSKKINAESDKPFEITVFYKSKWKQELDPFTLSKIVYPELLKENPSNSNKDTTSDSITSKSIPDWIRNNASWWNEGQIDDQAFVSGIQYLIKERIIDIPETTSTESSTDEIPQWVKNNAGWWADGSIDDEAFISGIKYLVEQGILQV